MVVTNLRAKKLLERLTSWSEEEIAELEEAARGIEARRTGVYLATAEELQVVDEAEQSGIATDAEVEEAFKAFRLP